MNPIRPITHIAGITLSLAICYFLSAISPASATTVFGNLTDISVAALNTKLMFAPTNEVLVAQSGLSAGPPKTIATVNGAFSLPLEPGNYTVSLPLITWRHPFQISVFDNPTPINITNLLTAPRTYTYTNPFVPPLHVNTAQVTVLSSITGDGTLLDSPVSIGAGSLTAGRVITIEAYGSISDPLGNAPSTTFTIQLGSTVIATQSQSTGNLNWHLRASITVRASGVTGSVAATEAILMDTAMPSFPCATTVTTLDTTVTLTVDLRASLTDVLPTEAIHCEQLVVHLE